MNAKRPRNSNDAAKRSIVVSFQALSPLRSVVEGVQANKAWAVTFRGAKGCRCLENEVKDVRETQEDTTG